MIIKKIRCWGLMLDNRHPGNDFFPRDAKELSILPFHFIVDKITIRLFSDSFLSTEKCLTTPTLANSFHSNSA